MQRTITIAAGGQHVERVKGHVFAVIAATAAFDIDANRSGRETVRANSKIVFDPFTRLLFDNTSGAENTIIFYAGDDDRFEPPRNNDATILIQNAGTYPKSSGVIPLPDEGQQFYSGLDGANTRKSFCIANRTVPTGVYATDFAAVLEVGTIAQPEGIPLYPGEKITIDCGGSISVLNDSGAEINYSVLEIFNSA